MIVRVYASDRGITDEPWLTLRVEGRSVYLGEDPFNNTVTLTIEANQIFSGTKELWEQLDPVATVINSELYRGRVEPLDIRGSGFEPLSTLEAEGAAISIYAGRREVGQKPIAVAEGGDLMSAACAAVCLLLLQHTRRAF
jgi:hypothetical protein